MPNAKGFCSKLWKFSQRFYCVLGERVASGTGVLSWESAVVRLYSRFMHAEARGTQGLIYRCLTVVLAYGNQKDPHKMQGSHRNTLVFLVYFSLKIPGSDPDKPEMSLTPHDWRPGTDRGWREWLF